MSLGDGMDLLDRTLTADCITLVLRASATKDTSTGSKTGRLGRRGEACLLVCGGTAGARVYVALQKT